MRFDRIRSFHTILFALVLVATQSSQAADDTHPIVLGFERFGTGENPVKTGRLLLGELNCLSCHSGNNADVETKKAPILDQVGARVRVEYLRKYLSNPHATKPGTTMPHVLGHLSESEREATAEALVHFLASTGSLVEQPADIKKVFKGSQLFHDVGCTACHAPQNGTEVADASIPLGKLSEKYSVPSLISFLSDPLKVRPSARMPGPHLTKNETEEIAHFLLQDLMGVIITPELANLPKIPYRYFEGNWQNLPDFDKLQPKATGTGPAFSLTVAPRREQFGLVFDAWFSAKNSGDYTFETASDDGSELLVNGKRVVLNDGVHPTQARSGKVKLDKGPHQITVRYFEAGGEEVLRVNVAGPGLPKQPLGPLVAGTKDELAKPSKPEPESNDDPEVFVIQPKLVEKGRELFTTIGCASCHQLTVDKRKLETAEATRRLAKPLSELNGGEGCLADSVTGNAPRFGLSASQRIALRNAISGAEPAPSKPEERIAQTFARFNCYGCHARDEIGGVPEARNELFKTTQKEMGDEGRIPPALNGVGAKLTTAWMKKIFAEGANDRPYMLTRMPKFGTNNIGHLQPILDATDTIEAVEIPTIDLPARRIKSLGRSMAGDSVFGCIKCHTFAGKKALGVQSIDMTIMTKRLKHDWFHKYIVKPSAFRPGTRMPTAWPQGRSTLRDVLDGDTHKQVEAIWQYLAEGSNARPPSGLNRSAIVLAPTENKAVIYRNFIEGAGTRAIGVAHPEKVNFAFDSNEMRLAIIWQNKFIDASKHWVGRGQGWQGPLGDQVLNLWSGVTFAALEDPSAAWPGQSAKDLGYQFKGYEVTNENRPKFLYEWNGIAIKDFPTGVATKPFLTLKRTLSLTRKSESSSATYFRAAVGGQIEDLSDGTYQVNEDYKIRITSAAKPIIVSSQGKAELRVPVEWKNDQAEIVQEITW